MNVAEGLCFAISAIAELLGIGLAVREAQHAQRIYRGYLESTRLPGDAVMRAFMERSVLASHHRLDAAERMVDYLMATKARWVTAAVLLLAGVLFGTVGNFLGLSS